MKNFPPSEPVFNKRKDKKKHGRSALVNFVKAFEFFQSAINV